MGIDPGFFEKSTMLRLPGTDADATPCLHAYDNTATVVTKVLAKAAPGTSVRHSCGRPGCARFVHPGYAAGDAFRGMG